MLKSKFTKISIACFLAVITAFFVVIPIWEKYYLRKMQTELAEILKVHINDYPNPETFPIQYFEIILETGMSKDEVHNYVRGYDSAYHCEGDFNFEIYNYFSHSRYYWLVILIPYNEYKQYDGDFKVWIDPNTNTVSGRACKEGVLE